MCPLTGRTARRYRLSGGEGAVTQRASPLETVGRMEAGGGYCNDEHEASAPGTSAVTHARRTRAHTPLTRHRSLEYWRRSAQCPALTDGGVVVLDHVALHEA